MVISKKNQASFRNVGVYFTSQIPLSESTHSFYLTNRGKKTMTVGREVSTSAVLAGCGVELFLTMASLHDLLYYYFS
jgi:hypothetical protein